MTTTKVLVPVLSAAVLAAAPALASGARAHTSKAQAHAAACHYKAGYDPLRDTITPRSRYISLQPHRVDHLNGRTNTVTTTYRWTWKPMNGAKICEFSYTQNGVMRHPKIVRDPNGGSWKVTFTWRRGVGKEHVFVTARP
jgi:hypothetical protein